MCLAQARTAQEVGNDGCYIALKDLFRALALYLNGTQQGPAAIAQNSVKCYVTVWMGRGI